MIARLKTTAKRELKSKSDELSLNDVCAIAARIHNAAEDLVNFHLGLISPGHPRATMA